MYPPKCLGGRQRNHAFFDIPDAVTMKKKWLIWSMRRKYTCTAVKLCSHGNPAVPGPWVNTDVDGRERSEELVINY